MDTVRWSESLVFPLLWIPSTPIPTLSKVINGQNIANPLTFSGARTLHPRNLETTAVHPKMSFWERVLSVWALLGLLQQPTIGVPTCKTGKRTAPMCFEYRAERPFWGESENRRSSVANIHFRSGCFPCPEMMVVVDGCGWSGKDFSRLTWCRATLLRIYTRVISSTLWACETSGPSPNGKGRWGDVGDDEW